MNFQSAHPLIGGAVTLPQLLITLLNIHFTQAEIEAELEAERREVERKKAEEAAVEERRQRILRKKAKQEQRVRSLCCQKCPVSILVWL